MFFEKRGPGGLPFFKSSLLENAGLTHHGFFGRRGGVSREGELNIGWNSWDSTENVLENLNRLSHCMEIKKEQLVFVNQVHGTTILDEKMINREKGLKKPEGDGVHWWSRGSAPVILTADCQPLIFYLPNPQPSLLSIHSGWKGVLQEFPALALKKIISSRGEEALANLKVALGPSIGPCCFEVKRDLWVPFTKTFGRFSDREIFLQRGRKFFIDLVQITTALLEEGGLPKENLDRSPHCTRCRMDLFFSYRGEGDKRGSNGSAAHITAL